MADEDGKNPPELNDGKDKKRRDGSDSKLSSTNTEKTSSSSSSSRGRSSHSSSTSKPAALNINMDDILKKMSDVMDQKLSKIEQRLNEFEYYEPENEAGTAMDTAGANVSELDLDNLINQFEPDQIAPVSNVDDNTAGVVTVTDNSLPSTSDNNVWQQIANEFTQDDSVGPEVNSALADMVNALFTKKMNDETMTQKMKNVLRPKNCANLVTPRINHLIWDRLKPNTRSFDIKLQRIQNCMLKTVCGIIDVLDVNGKVPTATVNKKLVTCLAMMSHGLSDFNMRRRDLIKPDLSSVYKNMCSSEIPVTDELFGGDLHKVMKDISDSQRIVNKMGPKRGPRDSWNETSRGRGRPWRGRGRGQRDRYHPYQSHFLGGGSQHNPSRDKSQKKPEKN